jgi:hypothetical protein
MVPLLLATAMAIKSSAPLPSLSNGGPVDGLIGLSRRPRRRAADMIVPAGEQHPGGLRRARSIRRSMHADP